ncbi:unnamed protein product [Choristocarpus tenellus]
MSTSDLTSAVDCGSTSSPPFASVSTGCGSRRSSAAIATDYHCTTVGLTEGGQQVMLCLVVKVAYRSAHAGVQTPEKVLRPSMLGFVLVLDHRSGVIRVLSTQTCRSTGGKSCAALCIPLAQYLKRSGGVVVSTCVPKSGPRVPQPMLTKPGRQLSNAAVLRGKSEMAILNPVYPVAIVKGA